MALEEIDLIKKFNLKYQIFSDRDFFNKVKNSEYTLNIKSIIDKKIIKPSFSWKNTTIESSKFKSKGTGEHFKDEIATIKSIYEAVERLSIIEENTNLWEKVDIHTGKLSSTKIESDYSNGIAFNLNIFKAIKSAFLEEVERDSILKCWAGSIECKRISPLNKYSFCSLLYVIQNKEWSCEYLQIKNKFNIPVVVCYISSKETKPYNCIGFGCSLDLKVAIEKSFYEAWRFFLNYHHLINKNTKNSNSIIDHFYDNVENLKDVDSVFKINQKIKIDPTSITDNNIVDELVRLNTSISIFEYDKIGLLGYSVKTLTPCLDKLWAGPLIKKYYNRNAGEMHPIA